MIRVFVVGNDHAQYTESTLDGVSSAFGYTREELKKDVAKVIKFKKIIS